MSISATQPIVTPDARPSVAHALWAGWAASVPAVIVATVVILETPHVRGIGFFTPLRFAVVTPLTMAISIASAMAFRTFAPRSTRPRSVMFAALIILSLVLWAGMLALGRPGLAGAALPALLVVGAFLGWLIPRRVTRSRGRIGTVATVLFGGLELLGVGRASSSESGPLRDGKAASFVLPHEVFGTDSRFVDLPDGAHVHYVDVGQGPVLLFLHGNPSWSYQWRELVRDLSKDHRCVALDYPGFGLSDAPPGFGFTPREESHVVEAFVDQLGLTDMTLIMQDWGGPIGLGLAGRRPELVRKVVLGSTWAWPTTTEEPRGKFSFLAGGPVGEFVQVNFNGFASLGVKNGIVHPASPEVLDMYLRPFVPLDRRGIAAFYPGQINQATDYFREVEAGLPRLRDKKALVFWALKDRGFPLADLHRFEDAFPEHRTIELPDADHFFFEDAADQMVPIIRTFVGEEPSARR